MQALIARYMAIAPRTRLLAAAALWALLIVGFSVAVHSGQAMRLSELDGRQADVEQKRAEKQAYAMNLPKYEARYSALQEALNTARSMLPDNPDVPQFLGQMGNTARDMGLVVDRFEPKEETYADFYAEIGFAMEVRGSYHEIGTFIDQVGRLDRIVNVTDLALTQPKSENAKVVLAGAFQVKTYRFLSEAQLKELDAAHKRDKKK